MTAPIAELPAGLKLTIDDVPPPDLRAMVAREINDFHSRTVPHTARRFSVRITGKDEALLGAVVGVISWEWLFIEALWVSDDLRGHGAGRRLMEEAQAFARNDGCHSAWLDTFQARPFYEAIGYEVFGQLEDFPAGQTRYFMRRKLG